MTCLTLFVLVTATFLCLAQTQHTISREDLITAIRERAYQDVAADKIRENTEGLNLLFGQEASAVGINLREVTVIYGEAYTQAKQQRPWWEKLTPQIGWITAAAVTLLLVFGSALKKTISNHLEHLNEDIYNKLAGHRLFQGKALRRYRQALINKYSRFKIPFGTERYLEMAQIYVPIKIKEKGDTVGANNSDINLAYHENIENEEIEGLDAIIRFKRVVILGAPGSGKSMLLRHITLSYAQNISKDLPNQIIPVLLKLSRFNDTDKSIEDHLINVFDLNGFPNASNLIRQSLKQGLLLLLFDGLDEVDSNKRQQVANRIKDFLERNGNRQCQAAITCRSAVYNNEFNDVVEQTLELVEFADQQVRQLLTSWPAMPPGKSAEQLILALRERPKIMSLARNPLLLTIVAFLYTDTINFMLPYSRTEFYEQAVDVLLQLKNEYNHYKKSQKELVLQHLALFNQDRHGQPDQNRVTFDLITALKEVNRLLPELNLENKDADPLLDEIVKRSGLLLELDGGNLYQFTHLTLQEFFAASALRKDSVALLARFKKDQDAWRETVKLWCGLGHDSTDFIRTIYNENPLLALECLSDAQQINPTVAEAIISEFKSQFGTGSMDSEAITLALATIASGPTLRSRTVFDFLTSTLNTDSVNERRVAAAIALSHTNKTDAVQPLSKYFNTIPEVQRAFVRMGDLAMSALKELAGEGEVQALYVLQSISTPEAASTLVRMLWHKDETLASKAAWCLATLLPNPTIESALRHYPLTETLKASPAFKWIWEPFGEDYTSSLPAISGRIGHLMYKHPLNIPLEIASKADQRIVIPLVVQTADELQLNAERIAKFKITPEFDSVLRDITKNSNDEIIYRSIQKESKDTSHITTYLRARQLKYALNRLSERPKDEDEYKKLQELRPKFTNELLKAISIGESNSVKLVQFLKTLSSQVQFDLLRRLFISRIPTISDWHNVFRPIKYRFASSWHYVLVLLITALFAVVSMISISINLTQSPQWISWHNGILTLSALSIVLTWYHFIRGTLWGRFNPDGLLFSIVGFLFFPIIITKDLIDLIRKQPPDMDAEEWFLALSIIPFTPAIGYFSTILMLNYFTLNYVIGFWLILIVSISLLTWLGKRRERAALNPLHGILEKPSVRGHIHLKRGSWLSRIT